MRWILISVQSASSEFSSVGSQILVPKGISEKAGTGETIISTKTTVLYVNRFPKFTLSE